MLSVLALGAALWAGATLLGAPLRVRLALIAVLWSAVMVVHLTLPDGHSLRMALGEDARFWGLLGGGAVLVWAYRVGLHWLRGKAESAAPANSPQRPRFLTRN